MREIVIDTLINNAGFSLVCPIELLDDTALRSVFETNVFGLVRVTRAFVPAMRARRSVLHSFAGRDTGGDRAGTAAQADGRLPLRGSPGHGLLVLLLVSHR